MGRRGISLEGGRICCLFSPGMVDNDEAQPLTTTETLSEQTALIITFKLIASVVSRGEVLCVHIFFFLTKVYFDITVSSTHSTALTVESTVTNTIYAALQSFAQVFLLM